MDSVCAKTTRDILIKFNNGISLILHFFNFHYRKIKSVSHRMKILNDVHFVKPRYSLFVNTEWKYIFRALSFCLHNKELKTTEKRHSNEWPDSTSFHVTRKLNMPSLFVKVIESIISFIYSWNTLYFQIFFHNCFSEFSSFKVQNQSTQNRANEVHE